MADKYWIKRVRLADRRVGWSGPLDKATAESWAARFRDQGCIARVFPSTPVIRNEVKGWVRSGCPVMNGGTN